MSHLVIKPNSPIEKNIKQIDIILQQQKLENQKLIKQQDAMVQDSIEGEIENQEQGLFFEEIYNNTQGDNDQKISQAEIQYQQFLQNKKKNKKMLTPSEKRYLKFQVKTQKSVLQRFFNQPKIKPDIKQRAFELQEAKQDFQEEEQNDNNNNGNNNDLEQIMEKSIEKSNEKTNTQQNQFQDYQDDDEFIFNDDEDSDINILQQQQQQQQQNQQQQQQQEFNNGLYKTFDPEKPIKTNKNTEKDIKFPFMNEEEKFYVYRVNNSVRSHVGGGEKSNIRKNGDPNEIYSQVQQLKRQFKRSFNNQQQQQENYLDNFQGYNTIEEQSSYHTQDQTNYFKFNNMDSQVYSRQNLVSREGLKSREGGTKSRENQRRNLFSREREGLISREALLSREGANNQRQNLLSREKLNSRHLQSREKTLGETRNIQEQQQQDGEQLNEDNSRGNTIKIGRMIKDIPELQIESSNKISTLQQINHPSLFASQNDMIKEEQEFSKRQWMQQQQQLRKQDSFGLRLEKKQSQFKVQQQQQQLKEGTIVGSNSHRKQKMQNTVVRRQVMERRKLQEKQQAQVMSDIFPEDFVRKVQMLFTDLNYLETYGEGGIEEMKEQQDKLKNAMKEYQELKQKIAHNEYALQQRQKLERREKDLRVRKQLKLLNASSPDQLNTPFQNNTPSVANTPLKQSMNSPLQSQKSLMKSPSLQSSIRFKSKKALDNFKVSQRLQQQQAKFELERQKQNVELEGLNIYTNEITDKEREFLEKENDRYLAELQFAIKELYGSLENMPEKWKKKYFRHIERKGLQNGGMQQEQVQGPMKEFFENDQNIHQDLIQLDKNTNAKFETYKKDNKREFQLIEKMRDQQITNVLQVNPNIVSQHEVKILEQNFKLRASKRNLDFIETISYKLKYLQQFSRATRIELLKFANLVTYPQGKYIFRQGDPGDKMYIIIRGSVHVRVRQKNIEGETENPVVVTLYDGQAFGELALMKQEKPQGLKAIILEQQKENKGINLIKIKKQIEDEVFNQEVEDKFSKKNLDHSEQSQKNNRNSNTNSQQHPNKKKRKSKTQASILEDQLNKIQDNQPVRQASIECAETSTFFTLGKEYFTAILINMIQKEQIQKLKLLQTLSFFDFYDALSLIPLTTYLEEKNFNLGEVVIKEGEEPQNFYFVSKGRFKIIKQQTVIREVRTMQKDNKKFGRYRLNTGYVDYKELACKVDDDAHNLHQNFFQQEKEEEIPTEQELDLKFSVDRRHASIDFDDKQYGQYGVQCELNSDVNEDKVILLDTLLEVNMKYKFVYKVTRLSNDSDIGIGICYRNKMESKNFVINDKKLGNGVFVIYSSGQMLSDIVESQNNKYYPEKFHFQEGDTIQVEIDPQTKLLTFINLDSENMTCTMDIKYKNYDYFSPCIVLKQAQDSLHIISSQQMAIQKQEQKEEFYEEQPPEQVNRFQQQESGDTKKYQFSYYHDFGSLCKGEFFMGRALIQEYLKINPMFKNDLKYDVSQNARLTVIADSSVAQCFVMPRSAIHMIQRELRQQLVHGIANVAEYDNHFDYEMENWTDEWDKFKVANLDNILQIKDIKKKENTRNHPRNE